MNCKQFFSSIAVGTLLSWALAAPASAQTAAKDGSAKESSGGLALEEIIVRAQRKSENLQVVPISITAITGEEIRQKNITRPEDLNTTVPGLSVRGLSLERGSAAYTLRGQGQILGGPDAAVAGVGGGTPL